MNKISIIIIIALFLLAGVAGYFFFQKEKPNTNIPMKEEKKSIQVFLPKANETVSSPLEVTGSVNGEGWIGFEGQVGTVKLFDSFGKELALGILTATEDWMKSSVNFESTLWFDYPENGTGKLVFYNENPSGEPERNKTFEIPVKLAKSSAAKTTFNVYFSQQDASDVSCEEVNPYKREVPKTQSVARAALEELIKGPTGFEKYAGAFTSINPGVVIQNLTITNGIARVDFNEALQKDVAGSCKVSAIRAQITQTLLQFPTVKEVVISINGKTEGILQP